MFDPDALLVHRDTDAVGELSYRELDSPRSASQCLQGTPGSPPGAEPARIGHANALPR
jgi:hypothetical protein